MDTIRCVEVRLCRLGNLLKWALPQFSTAKGNESWWLYCLDLFRTPQILLPPSQIAWLLDRTDNELSAAEFHRQALEGDYSFTDLYILKDPYHVHVIQQYLPKRIGQLLPVLQEEVRIALDETWGDDECSWKDICVGDDVRKLVPRTMNRILVGSPLCRNAEYVTNTALFTREVITTARGYLSAAPWFLRPIVGCILSRANRHYYRQTAKHSIPIIRRRLANFQTKQHQDDNLTRQRDDNQPNDYIDWHINLAMSENRLDELDADRISRRLLAVNFAAIHTTTLTLINCILDLVFSDPRQGYLEGVREEATSILAGTPGGYWTKAGLASAHRTDSTIRESMRLNNFSSRGLMRKVVSKGVGNRGEGWSAPRGATIGVNIHRIHHDPLIYLNPDRYDAFRFSRYLEKEKDDKDDKQRVGHEGEPRLWLEGKVSKVGLTTTSDTFLPFGLGRHACPGRLLAAALLKMMVAYMVLNYEIEAPPEAAGVRPSNRWMGPSTYLPPAKANIRVRRRKTGAF